MRVPKAYDMWATAMQQWIENTARVIEVERALGAAPVSLPAIEMATALNLMNERVMIASFADERPAVPAERVVDTLVTIWISTIYGDTS